MRIWNVTRRDLRDPWDEHPTWDTTHLRMMERRSERGSQQKCVKEKKWNEKTEKRKRKGELKDWSPSPWKFDWLCHSFLIRIKSSEISGLHLDSPSPLTWEEILNNRREKGIKIRKIITPKETYQIQFIVFVNAKHLSPFFHSLSPSFSFHASHQWTDSWCNPQIHSNHCFWKKQKWKIRK